MSRSALSERFAIACAIAACVAGTVAAQSPSGSCEALTGLKLQDTTITTAAAVAAGPFKPNANASAPAMTVPAFCRVAATLKPTPESNIRIEVWLPSAETWNGKFLGTGNGGAGVISYPALANGLAKGYATNTDMGTQRRASTSASRSATPGWSSTGATARRICDPGRQTGREVVQARPAAVYFMGCSTGGHQALTEARRYRDYNGIVAGDPANNRVRLHMVGYWNRGDAQRSGQLHPHRQAADDQPRGARRLRQGRRPGRRDHRRPAQVQVRSGDDSV
jgi:feruloyl esterase